MGYFEKQAFTKDQAEKYGIDLKYETVNGRHEAVDWEASNAAVTKAMANDYDTRRTIEAAQMSGNKKANKLGQGISNISEAVNAERFMAKTHKNRMGNTGEYSSANDEGGVTDYWINKERGKQNAQFATKDDLSALNRAQREVTEQTIQQPVEDSPELSQAKERVQAWEGSSNLGTNPSPYGASGSKIDFDNMTFGSSAYRDSSGEPTNGEQAQGQLDKFKSDLKERKNLQPTL